MWKLLLNLCNALQHQIATSTNILPFFPLISKKDQGPSCYSGKACFWLDSFSLRLRPFAINHLLLSFIFTFFLFADLFSSGYVSSSQKVNQQTKLKWSLFHFVSLPLPSNFSPPSFIQTHYLQFLRITHSSAQCDLILNPINRARSL